MRSTAIKIMAVLNENILQALLMRRTNWRRTRWSVTSLTYVVLPRPVMATHAHIPHLYWYASTGVEAHNRDKCMYARTVYQQENDQWRHTRAFDVKRNTYAHNPYTRTIILSTDIHLIFEYFYTTAVILAKWSSFVVTGVNLYWLGVAPQGSIMS